ncbi:hypothetical protein N8077_02045 [Myxococcota bacterium]|nr:hypothetical protein [Myxococcota bacterium]
MLRRSPASFVGIALFARTAAAIGCSNWRGEAASERPDAALTSESVDAARILASDATSTKWLSHGRTYDEQRFSRVAQIDSQNVSDPGFTFFTDLPTKRGIETPPLMADGKLYVTAFGGHVLAYDACST